MSPIAMAGDAILGDVSDQMADDLNLRIQGLVNGASIIDIHKSASLLVSEVTYQRDRPIDAV